MGTNLYIGILTWSVGRIEDELHAVLESKLDNWLESVSKLLTLRQIAKQVEVGILRSVGHDVKLKLKKIEDEECIFTCSDIESKIEKAFKTFNDDKDCVAILAYNDELIKHLASQEKTGKDSIFKQLKKPMVMTLVADVKDEWMRDAICAANGRSRLFSLWAPQAKAIAKAFSRYISKELELTKTDVDIAYGNEKYAKEGYAKIVWDEFVKRIDIESSNDQSDTQGESNAPSVKILLGYGIPYLEELKNCLMQFLENEDSRRKFIITDTTFANFTAGEIMDYLKRGASGLLHEDRLSEINICYISTGEKIQAGETVTDAIVTACEFINYAYDKRVAYQRDSSKDSECVSSQLFDAMCEIKSCALRSGELLIDDNWAHVNLSVRQVKISPLDRWYARSDDDNNYDCCIKVCNETQLYMSDITTREFVAAREFIDDSLKNTGLSGLDSFETTDSWKRISTRIKDGLLSRYGVCSISIDLNALKDEFRVFDTSGFICQYNLKDDCFGNNGSYRCYVEVNGEHGESEIYPLPLAIKKYNRKAVFRQNVKVMYMARNKHIISKTQEDNVSRDVKQLGEGAVDRIFDLCTGECSFVYYIPGRCISAYNRSDGGFSILEIKTKRELAYSSLEVLKYTIDAISSCIHDALTTRVLMNSNIRTAIGTIMSRNGSHNIGSHVLAALSHNVGTMPDDRVLYQYIQHRMDYIATVTTGMPKWRHPMQFVGDIMKHFLSQRHLLDYIAGSEGLKAWQFQNPNANNSHCLKFHVRRMETCSVDVNGVKVHKRVLVHDFLEYPESGSIDLTYDVPLAIPGGIVGQHAVFTIFENVVRNAAKHDWAVLHPLSAKSEDPCDDDNLDIYIEFEDKPESGVVEFIVYTSKSDANVVDGVSGKALWRRQNERLNAPLINDQGELRRESWGLAEMKISAGCLQSREMNEIGGLDVTDEKILKDRKCFGPIIEAVPIDKDAEDKDKLELKGRLGYKFKVPKPKTILLVAESKESVPQGVQAVKLMEAGIYVRAREQIKPVDDDMSAEFVIVSAFDEKCLHWHLPFRIITMHPDQNLSIVSNQLASWLNPLSNIKFDSVNSIVRALCCDSLTPETLTKHVATCWMDYIVGRRSDLSGKLNLIVAPTFSETVDDEGRGGRILRVGDDGKSHGSGKSLINPASVVSYVFEEGFDRAVNSFIKLYNLENVHGEDHAAVEKKNTYVALTAMRDMHPRQVESNIRKSEAEYETLVLEQLKGWMASLECSNDVLRYLESRCACGDDSELADISQQIAELKKSMPSKYSVDPRWRDLVRRSNRINSRRREAAWEHFFSHFVDYLVEVCKQAKGYLGKYAENISSLPAGYEIKQNGKTLEGDRFNLEGTGGSDWEYGNLHVYTKCVDCEQQPVVQYVRHLNQSDGIERPQGSVKPPSFVTSPFAAFQGSVLYAESLSGTQSYLNQLMRLSPEKAILQAKLVENALVRLLILDERMSQFVREHSDLMLATFARMSITIAEERTVGAKEAASVVSNLERKDSECTLHYTSQGLLEINPAHVRALLDLVTQSEDRAAFEERFDKAKIGADMYRNRFDILIIHQGIIDKWFSPVAHDPEKMPLLLYGLRRVFPYVVITTGRGIPANVPEMARVLPFPTVATTMFKKYPEKLVLVDAIMNLLPVRKR